MLRISSRAFETTRILRHASVSAAAPQEGALAISWATALLLSRIQAASAGEQAR